MRLDRSRLILLLGRLKIRTIEAVNDSFIIETIADGCAAFKQHLFY